jgi:uncharacterized protein DUF3105
MAQRKPPNTAPNKPGAAKRAPAGAKGVPGRPPTRKPGKSIVNQKQTPWGLIITTVVLVLFAGGIVTYAVTQSGKDDNNKSICTSSGNTCYVQPEVAAAKKIKGVEYHKEPSHNHVTTTVKYDRTPPIGGNHSPLWATCTGVVYDHQIANENAVHMLEHGAVWITYNPTKISTSDLNTLKSLVDGVNYMALSPYAGLKTTVSLQAWDYQLFVDKATDPRVQQFVDALRFNPKTTPEPGAGCADPSFDASKSTFGHPYSGT